MNAKQELHRRELIVLYGTYADDHLLAVDEADLTDLARTVFRDELARRGLEPHLDGRRPCHEDAPELVVWSGRSMEGAAIAQQMLEIHGITSSIITAPGSPAREQFQVRVPASQAETSLEVLERGPSNESAGELLHDFLHAAVVLPACHACRSENVAFIDVRAENRWQCEDCGVVWEETPSASADGASLAVAGREDTPEESPDDHAKKQTRLLLNRSVAILMVGFCLAIIVTQLPQHWDKVNLVGLSLWLVSLTLWAFARWQLGASFTGKAEARELVTTGIYARLQNPIYLSSSLLIVGCCLYLEKPLWLLALVLVLPMQVIRIRRERAVLAAALGKRYLDYRKSTWF